MTSEAFRARGDTFDATRTRGNGPADLGRSFRTATRLGWQMEANWTDPALFFIYSVAKPVSSALILVVMLEVIGGAAGREFRGFVVVGSALWSFVTSGIAGLAWSILDDRERYRMLKYVYVSPSDFVVVLLGRGVARVAVGAMGALITLGVGVTVLGVPVDPAGVDWILLAAVMALGLVAIVAIGVVLAGICIQTRQESWSYPEAVAGAMFLVTGAVFPLAVLPAPVQAIGLLTPLSWWIAGVREALFPGGVSSVGGDGSLFADLFGRAVPDPLEIVLALLVTGALVTLAAAGVFRWSERRARDRGLLDRTTGS
ncbi:MAG TPA: ABC transporter permease [Candidatus Limnocylindrales bacterium]|nr:ABC transporter permease [Candidatus Limnocylindrales bacterium]